MGKYINQDKLIREGWSLQRTYQKDATTMVCEMKKPEDFPTADVRPVVRGHWVPMDDFPHEDWECDVCGACLCGDESIPQNFNYCPNCGAEMDGGDAE